MDIENKLIAEFMGYEFVDGDFKIPHSDKTRNSDFSEWCSTYGDIDGMFSVGYLLAPSNLMYHSDWNWLMEVVEKINTMDEYQFSLHIYYCRVTIYDNLNKKYILDDFQNVDTLITTYKAVVQFIKWYNEQK